MKIYKKYMPWIIAFILGVALIAVYKTFDNFQNILTFIGQIFSALTPFIIGFVIAYILNFPCRKLEKLFESAKFKWLNRSSKGLSIFLVYILFIAIIFIVMRNVIPALYKNITDLYNNIIPATQSALTMISDFQKKIGVVFFDINAATAKDTIQRLLSGVNVGEFGKYAQGAIAFTSSLLKVFIALIISIYMLTDRDRLIAVYRRVLFALFPADKAENVHNYLVKINVIFSNYIYSCVLDALIVAILATIILSIIGVKYSIIFGTFIGLCNLIPYFGSIISNCVTVVITFFTGGWVKAVWTAAALFLLGQIDGNFIGPKIMGSKLDVKPLLIIFAVTLGGGLFGVIGMLLSVPVMMVLKLILSDVLHDMEVKRK